MNSITKTWTGLVHPSITNGSSGEFRFEYQGSTKKFVAALIENLTESLKTQERDGVED